MTDLLKGQTVVIAGKAGVVTGEVIDVRGLDNLVEIEGIPLNIVRSILIEMMVDQVAAIEHLHSGVKVTFVAMHSLELGWLDLQGQALTISQFAKGAPS